jgi:hypothetical protein
LKADRLNHTDRAWVLGHFSTENMGPTGIPSLLVAQDTWGSIDRSSLPQAQNSADPLTQAALSVDFP